MGGGLPFVVGESVPNSNRAKFDEIASVCQQKNLGSFFVEMAQQFLLFVDKLSAPE